MMICIGFWWGGSGGRWAILEGSKGGLFLTAGVIGVGGAVAEALGECFFPSILDLRSLSGRSRIG
jgi:hypothetical protein